MNARLSHWSVVISLVAVMPCLVHAADHTKDSLATVKMRVAEDKAVLVDVREQSEWDRGHISGAALLPLSELRNGISAESLTKRLPKKRIVYTHCAIGVRSCTAADILLKHGYDVRPLKPGYKDLIAAGFKKAKK